MKKRNDKCNLLVYYSGEPKLDPSLVEKSVRLNRTQCQYCNYFTLARSLKSNEKGVARTVVTEGPTPSCVHLWYGLAGVK